MRLVYLFAIWGGCDYDGYMKLQNVLLRQLDKFILYNMSQRIPPTLERSVQDCTPFETILARTEVVTRPHRQKQTAVPPITDAGEHSIWLQSDHDLIPSVVNVRPAATPDAPLIIYHHGLNEYPYTSSWRRIFYNFKYPYHLVCVRAPFHHNWTAPISQGFATVNSIYQLFAGSMRLMAHISERFDAQGVEKVVFAGTSWGGIAVMLYEAFFQNSTAVIPMLSAPNLARVMLDSADLFEREVTVQTHDVYKLLDFTTYYEQCEPSKLFPLLGEHDMFFRYGSHAETFRERPLTIIPLGHISAMWPGSALRQHVISTLDQLSL